MTMGGLPLTSRVSTVVLIAVTAVGFGTAIGSAPPISVRDLIIGFLLGSMISLAAVFDISFPHTTGLFHVSVGAPIALATGLTLGPVLGGSIVIAAILIESIYAHRAVVKTIVNVTTLGLVTFLGAVVYEALADPALMPLGSIRNMGAVVAASVVFSLVNLTALSAIVAPIIGIHPLQMARTNLSGFYVQAVTLPTFGAIMPVLAREHPIALLVIVIPLVGPFLALKGLAKTREETRETMEGLADALERRDPYTHRHSMRVTQYVQSILSALSGVPAETAEGILMAARVHDIGKIAVRDLVLNKPGSLTAAEFKEIQDHASIGSEMVAPLGVYRPWVSVIRHHHERWDGSGYPNGLAGESIPLGARIIAVADAFDAMTTDRVYRKALDQATSLRELKAMSGSQFDPEIVAALDRALNPSTASQRQGVPSPSQPPTVPTPSTV